MEKEETNQEKKNNLPAQINESQDNPVQQDENKETLTSETPEKGRIDRVIECLHDHLPGGDFRKLDKMVDEHSEHLQQLKEKISEKKWWEKIPLIGKHLSSKNKEENIKTIETLEKDIQELKKTLKWKTTWGLILGLFGGFALTTVGYSSFTGKFVSFLLEKNANLEEDISDTDLAIVIADDVKESEKGHFASEILDHNSLLRLNSAIQFSNEKNIPIMLAGSQEAINAMQKTAIGLGMSPDMIYTEKASGNVKEKAINSRNECHDRNIKSPVIFTTAYKVPRTLCEFRRQGLNVKPFPVSKSNLDMNMQIIKDAVDYNPAMVKDAMYEYAKYILSGCAFMSDKKTK